MSYEQELFSRVGGPQSKESREAEQAMLEFFCTCKDRKVAVGVVLVPHLTPLKEKVYPFLYLHQRVKALCVKEDIRCVDLLETFSPYLTNGNHASLWVNRFDPHMGPLANQLASRRLIEVFGPVWAMDQTVAQAQ